MDWLHEIFLSQLTASKLKKARELVLERVGVLDGERDFASLIIQRITDAILDRSGGNARDEDDEDEASDVSDVDVAESETASDDADTANVADAADAEPAADVKSSAKAKTSRAKKAAVVAPDEVQVEGFAASAVTEAS